MGISKRLFEEYYEKYILNNISEEEEYAMMQREEAYLEFLKRQNETTDANNTDTNTDNEDLPF